MFTTLATPSGGGPACVAITQDLSTVSTHVTIAPTLHYLDLSTSPTPAGAGVASGAKPGLGDMVLLHWGTKNKIHIRNNIGEYVKQGNQNDQASGTHPVIQCWCTSIHATTPSNEATIDYFLVSSTCR